jgi:hypothetical protein
VVLSSLPSDADDDDADNDDNGDDDGDDDEDEEEDEDDGDGGGGDDNDEEDDVEVVMVVYEMEDIKYCVCFSLLRESSCSLEATADFSRLHSSSFGDRSDKWVNGWIDGAYK